MANSLFNKTVSPLLFSVLKRLMVAKAFDEFRLVGGTGLSLHRGHRESVDIDLFTDAVYGSIDFNKIDSFLRSSFPYVDISNNDIIGFGKSYFVGDSAFNSIKLDVFYTDEFIDSMKVIDNIRLASIEEIIAMKLDVVQRGGRKKDFWDLHELMDEYSISEMFSLHEKRYPYSHDKHLLKKNFTSFDNADGDFDPVCLREKHWELIKLDLIDFVKTL